jgi:D-galactosamine 6-phosphate deaminase/isomerase
MSQSNNGSLVATVLSMPVGEQQAGGFRHTLREIWQQPELWEVTACQISSLAERLRALLSKANAIVLTGSGSSQYVGECLAHPLQTATALPTRVVSSGELLLLGNAALPPIRPLLVVSFARSGDSPESAELIRRLLEDESEVEHLVLTCNRTGRLAEIWGRDGLEPSPRVEVITLDDRTCDRSLVMTSSFTNLVLAGLGLARVANASEYTGMAAKVANLGRELLSCWSDPLAKVADGSYRRMIVLGDGSAYGAARESALKTLEMTDGRVMTLAETTLGFRHGPMCSLHSDALLVLFVSSDPVRRAFELDLLDEIRRKGLGGQKIIVGGDLPSPAEEGELVIDLPEMATLPDEWASLLFTVVGQLLGFFRCRAEGLRPDEPAANGAISRVVSDFRLHAGKVDRRG